MSLKRDAGPYDRYKKMDVINGNAHIPERQLPVDLVIVGVEDRPRFERLFLRAYLRYLPLTAIELQEMAVALGANEEEQYTYKRQQAGGLVLMMRYRKPEVIKAYGENIKKRVKEIRKVLKVNWDKFTEDKDCVCVIAVPSQDKSKWPADMLEHREHVYFSKTDRDVWEHLFLLDYLKLRKLDADELAELRDKVGPDKSAYEGMLDLLYLNGDALTGLGDKISAALLKLKDCMDRTWANMQTKNGEICSVEIPAQDKGRLPGEILGKIRYSYTTPPLQKHEVVGISYAALGKNISYGDVGQATIEGTYVPSNYRSRHIGSQILEGFIGQLFDKYVVRSAFIWTHEDNPNTPYYSTLKVAASPNSATIENPGTIGVAEFNAIQTDEEMLVMPLSKKREKQYKKIERKPLPDMSLDMAARIKTEADNFVVVAVTESDKASFQKLYKGYLGVENQDYNDKKFEEVFKLFISGKIKGYLLKPKNNDEFVGMGILQSDIKLPRDSFLTAQASLFIDDEHRNMATARALMSHMFTEAAVMKDVKAVRWILQRTDPHLLLTKQPMQVGDREFKPSQFPFRLFRIGGLYRGPVVGASEERQRT